MEVVRGPERRRSRCPRSRHRRLDEHGAGAERDERLRAFAGYTVDTTLLAASRSPDAIVLHCLPAHPGEEIAADVLYGPRSAVWDEAENRLHTAKAVLALTLVEAAR